MKNIYLFLILVPTLLLISSCAPSRYVRTLEKGEKHVSGSLGGAVTNIGGITFPVPMTNLNIGYGIKDDLTLHGSIYTTALIFKTVQIDIGATKRLYQADSNKIFIPNISGSFTLNNWNDWNEGAFDILPQLDLNAYWNYGSSRQHYFYIGNSNWIDLNKYRAHNEIQPNRMIVNAHIGNVWKKNQWSYTLEYKILGIGLSNQNIVMNYAKWHGTRSVPGIFFSIGKNI